MDTGDEKEKQRSHTTGIAARNGDSETMRVILGITREEWSRRFDLAVERKNEDELRELEKSSAVTFRSENEPGATYRLDSTLTANASLVEKKAETAEEATRLAHKYIEHFQREREAKEASETGRLSKHDLKIWNAIKDRPGLKGMKYCLALHNASIRPRRDWIEDEDCPSTYPAAYRSKKWRQRINGEKSKLTGKVRTPPTAS